MMPLNTFPSSTLSTPFLGEQGADAGHLFHGEPNNWAITHLLLMLSWGSLSGERVIPHMMGPDPSSRKIRGTLDPLDGLGPSAQLAVAAKSGV